MKFIRTNLLRISCLFTSIGLVFLAGCGTNTETDSTEARGAVSETQDQVRGVSEDEILFGIHTDLSGPIARYGTETVNGINMRFNEVNRDGGVHGRKLRLIAEDSEYSPQNSIRITNKLIHGDKIFAMLMALGTPNNLAVMDEQFEAGVPNLFPFTGSIKMAQPYRKLMFTQRGIYYYEMRAAVKYFVEERGRTKPCVAYINNEYGEETYTAVKDQTAEMGIEFVDAASHDRTETEFTANVLRLRQAGCDLVLLGTVVIDTLGILAAAQEIGWEDVDWVGCNAAAGSVIAEHESGMGEGYFVFNHLIKIYPDTEENEEIVEWYNKFLELYGSEPDVAAMEGYRSADLVIQALEAVGPDVTTEGFISALESIGTYTDLFGYELHFTEDNHNGVRESVLAQAQDKRWVVLDQRIEINM